MVEPSSCLVSALTNKNAAVDLLDQSEACIFFEDLPTYLPTFLPTNQSNEAPVCKATRSLKMLVSKVQNVGVLSFFEKISTFKNAYFRSFRSKIQK